jgi:hypothetical protein
VRYDPFDLGVAYAYVQDRWVRCISQYYAQFQGYSEKARLLAAAELRQRQQARTPLRVTAKHLAEFLARATGHEALLLQRLHDQEARRVLAAIAGSPTLGDEEGGGSALCPGAKAGGGGPEAPHPPIAPDISVSRSQLVFMRVSA